VTSTSALYWGARRTDEVGRKLKDYHPVDLAAIQQAASLVKRAAALLRAAGAAQAAARVRSCVKSVEGAVRHAERCAQRAQEEAPPIYDDADDAALLGAVPPGPDGAHEQDPF